MVGIVIVSHSSMVAEGIRDLAMQMADRRLRIKAAGGMRDGSIGTDAVRICDAVRDADNGDGVVITVDLGSAVLSTSMALELLQQEASSITARIADAPVLEGTICAAVQASIGSSMEAVVAAAEEARGMSKL